MSARGSRRRLRYYLGVSCGVIMMALIIRQNESVVLSSLAPEPVRTERPVAAGSLKTTRHITSLSMAQVDTGSRADYGVIDPVSARYAVETYDISYISRLPATSRPIEVHARLYLPSGSIAAPAFVFGPGTTGPGPDCAPTLEQIRGKNWGHYDDHMEYYAGQGYAVAMVDYYRGAGDSAIHPYFVGDLEGRVMLDAAIALHDFRDDTRPGLATVAEPTFFAGYSQGAHAALWAEQLGATYAPGIHIAGIIGFAAATDVVRSVADIAKGSTTIWLPSYVYAAYSDYYGDLEPANTIFKEPFASTVAQDARHFCIDQLELRTGHYGPPSNAGSVYTPEFLQAAKDGTLAVSFPRLYAHLYANLAGSSSDHTPVLLVAGDKDVVILPAAQAELARRICASPLANLELQQSAAGTHYTAMAEGHKTVITWMQTIVNGGTRANNCGKYQ